MKIAVLNSGSSSIKYRVFEMEDQRVIASGSVEGIGESVGRIKHAYRAHDGDMIRTESDAVVVDHGAGFEIVRQRLSDETTGVSGTLDGIGHRVVHGGETFREPVVVSAEVIDGIRAQSDLAPLHNPANLVGIEAAMKNMPDTPQVAVFDTAFHQTIPAEAYLYALPIELYERYRVRRYGFHGTSHRYVSRRAARFLGIDPSDFNGIVLHLGNGASVTAIRGGESVDTSMGLTPLEGLVMGTRSGDVDPAVHRYLSAAAGMSIEQIDDLLNRRSGLRGLCGENDMRRVEARMEEGDDSARLAFEVFCYRARKYIGAYAAVLGRVDAVVFTAGIGENSPAVRRAICQDLGHLGIELDEERNAEPGALPAAIQGTSGSVKVLVVPTDEELEIAMQTRACIRNAR